MQFSLSKQGSATLRATAAYVMRQRRTTCEYSACCFCAA